MDSKKLASVLLVGVVIILAIAILGCTSQKPQAPKQEPTKEVEPIVIGLAVPRAYVEGSAAEKAAILAVEEINANGGVNVGGVKRPIKLEIEDTRDLEPGVPVSETLSVVERLILEKNAFAILGVARTEASLATMDLVAKYNDRVIYIASTGSYSPTFTKRIAENYEKYKNCFRIHGNVKFMIADLMKMFGDIKERYGFNKVYILAQDVAWAHAGAEVSKKLLEKAGWEVINVEYLPTGTVDFSSSLLNVKNSGAQVMLLFIDMPEVATLIKQWHDLKIPALPIGYVGPAQDPGFWKASDGKVAYVVVAGLLAGLTPSNATDLTMKFYNAYEKRWGKGPESFGAPATYMAIYVLANAIERAGSLDVDKVIKAMENTDMVGVYGRIRFDNSHEVIFGDDPSKTAVTSFFQWKPVARRVTVFPPAIATEDIELPPWMSPAK